MTSVGEPVVLDLDAKLVQALAPHMQRVLVVDPAPASARLLTDLLHNVWPGQVWTAATTSAGLSMAKTTDPQIVFVESAGEELDGLAFTRKLRRSDYSCRKAPVIMVTAQATPQIILGARDAGVHEFLRKPYTNKDLVRRLEAVSLHPRTWVEAVGYVGPDRRRFNSAEFKGNRKRQTDALANPQQARMVQALKIVSAALAAIEADPAQALRSLNAQTSELQRAAGQLRLPELALAANALQAKLADAARGEPLVREAIEPLANRLLEFLPRDEAVGARNAA